MCESDQIQRSSQQKIKIILNILPMEFAEGVSYNHFSERVHTTGKEVIIMFRHDWNTFYLMQKGQNGSGLSQKGFVLAVKDGQ